MPKSRKKHVALFYGHVASNIGDLAINTGSMHLLNSLPEVGRITVVLLDSRNSKYLELARSSFESFPNVTCNYFQSHGEKSLRFIFEPQEFLLETGTADCDLIMLSAGEHLFSYVNAENLKAMFWRTFPAFAANCAGIPCALLPSTLGPFELPQSRELFSALSDCVDGIAVRDEMSPDLAAQLVDPEKIRTLIDPAFFLVPDEPGKSTGVRQGGNLVALIMRAEGMGIRINAKQRAETSSNFDEEGYRNSRAYQFSVELGRRLLQDDSSKLEIFVQTDADQSLAERVKDALDAGYRVTVYRPVSVDDYVTRMSQVDHVVATRFHALVIGLLLQKSVFGGYFTEHGHKMPGLFRMLGIDDRCYSLSDHSPERVADDISMRIEAEPGEMSTEVRDMIQAGLAETREWLSALAGARKKKKPSWSMRFAGTLGAVAQQLAAESIKLVYEKKIETVNQSRLAEKKDFAEQQKVFRRLKEQNRALEADTRAYEKAIEVIDKKFASLQSVLQGELSSYTERIEDAQDKILALKDERHELKAQISALSTELDHANSKCLDLQNQMVEFDRLRNAFNQLSSRCESEKERSGLLEVQLVNHQNRLAQAQESLSRARDEAIAGEDLARRKISALQNRLSETRSSLQFEVGELIARAYRRPLNLIRLPVWFFRLYRERRRRHSAVQVGHPEPHAKSAVARRSAGDDATMVRIYRGKGVDGVVDQLQARAKDQGQLALELQRTGKICEEAGLPGSEFELSRRALDLDRSFRTLRAHFWAAQRAAEYEEACDVILEIEEGLEHNPSPGEAKRLEQLKKSASYQLSMSRHIQDHTARLLEPVSKRICYILHNSLPYSSGGYATRTHGLSTGLHNLGYEVHAITRPGYPCDIVTDVDESTVELHEVISDIHYHRLLHPPSKGIPVARYVRESADHMEHMFRELRPAVVMAASNHRVGIMALIAARRLGIPFIYEVRGWWEVTRQSRDPEFFNHPSYWVQRRLETVTCQESDFVFTLTNAMREELVERGVDSDKIEILPNSCDTTRFEPRSRDEALSRALGIPRDVPVIGYVGTFVDYEGLELLAEAGGLLKQRKHQFRLLLVGNENASGSDSGPITAEIMRLAEECGFSDWLIMPGRVPHEAVESYYSLIDIAPFPRRPWPVCEMVSPMKPLEAMAMEKAVVVSSVAALKEMVRDGETGLVFQKGDVESLTNAIATLMTDPGLRRRLGEEGRRWVDRERSWDAAAAIASRSIENIV